MAAASPAQAGHVIHAGQLESSFSLISVIGSGMGTWPKAAQNPLRTSL